VTAQNDSFEVRASAPGKIIILGEHFVVHGSQAVAAAINKRATVSVKGTTNRSRVRVGRTLSELDQVDGQFVAVKSVANETLRFLNAADRPIDIEVESELPPGSGLGSSAAVSVATAAAILRFFGESASESKVSSLARYGEGSVHGNPSGIDVATCLYGGTIMFSKAQGQKTIVPSKDIRFIVAFSKIPRNTSALIDRVSKHRRTYPVLFENLSRSISMVSTLGGRAIEEGDLRTLGTLLNVCQVALAWIGASSSEIEKLIEEMLSAGHCYGAKLTGAGGGGSVIALPEYSETLKIISEISKEYPYTLLTGISEEGLKFHE
jgi:mevalonate kinase